MGQQTIDHLQIASRDSTVELHFQMVVRIVMIVVVVVVVRVHGEFDFNREIDDVVGKRIHQTEGG